MRKTSSSPSARPRARTVAASDSDAKRLSSTGPGSLSSTAPETIERQNTASDVALFSRAKAQWMAGDWRSLSGLPDEVVEVHPERDRLALLVGCAQQQVGQHDLAKSYVRKALAWGCDPGLVARLLVSGVHNTLGGIRALEGNDGGMSGHFNAALSTAGETDSGWATRTRAIRELARIGLLPQAASLLEDGANALTAVEVRPMEMESRVATLKSEIELLQSELVLAQTRYQIGPGAQAAAGTADMAQDFVGQLKQRSPSQLGQDLWALERSNYKRGGFFVEFGATDGVLLSNTYLLEREFGWKGICAEPNRAMNEKLRRNRTCTISDACIGPITGESVNFVMADVYGGIEKWAFEDSHADKREAYRRAGEVVEMTTISLDDLLTQLDAPRQIDYLSIDTEGSELSILSTFPFDKWQVRLISVEHNFSASRPAIQELLEGHGYRRRECQFDDFYEKAP